MINKILPDKKNNWLYWLRNLVIFLLILVLLDVSIGSILKKFYFKIKSGTQYNTTYAIEKTTASLMIFGSSRAVHNYVPGIFEAGIHLTCYNAGRDGELSTIYHYGVLKGILKRYTPKMVVLDLMSGELGFKLYTYDKLASLSPYYGTHPEMRSIIKLRSDHEQLKMLSGIYPFNSLIMSIISGNLGAGKKNKEDRGYMPILATRTVTKPQGVINESDEYPLDSIKVNVLQSFIKDCAAHNIKLYIVCSPYYIKSVGTDYSIINIKKIAAQSKIQVFDFSQDSFFLNNPKLFGDTWHLNDSGAKIFSARVVDSISTYK